MTLNIEYLSNFYLSTEILESEFIESTIDKIDNNLSDIAIDNIGISQIAKILRDIIIKFGGMKPNYAFSLNVSNEDIEHGLNYIRLLQEPYLLGNESKYLIDYGNSLRQYNVLDNKRQQFLYAISSENSVYFDDRIINDVQFEVPLNKGLLKIGEKTQKNLQYSNVTLEKQYVGNQISDITINDLNSIENPFIVQKLKISELSTKIQNNSMSSTSLLQDIYFPTDSKLTSIGDNCFNGALIDTLVLPKSLKRIGSSSFCGNTYLSNIVMHDGIQFIGKDSFLNLSPDCTIKIIVSGNDPSNAQQILRYFDNHIWVHQRPSSVRQESLFSSVQPHEHKLELYDEHVIKIEISDYKDEQHTYILNKYNCSSDNVYKLLRSLGMGRITSAAATALAKWAMATITPWQLYKDGNFERGISQMNFEETDKQWQKLIDKLHEIKDIDSGLQFYLDFLTLANSMASKYIDSSHRDSVKGYINDMGDGILDKLSSDLEDYIEDIKDLPTELSSFFNRTLKSSDLTIEITRTFTDTATNCWHYMCTYKDEYGKCSYITKKEEIDSVQSNSVAATGLGYDKNFEPEVKYTEAEVMEQLQKKYEDKVAQIKKWVSSYCPIT